MRKEVQSRITAITIAIFSIILLILSGPVNAYNLNIDSSSPIIPEGNDATFIVNNYLVDDEKVAFEKFNFTLFDQNNKTITSCLFYHNGTIASECEEIEITQTFNTQYYGYSYGYGYGYHKGKGDINMYIKINSSLLETGNYSAKITSYVFTNKIMKNPEMFSNETTITVTPSITECSDGIDNDGDGKIDLEDTGCRDSNDDDESDSTAKSCSLRARKGTLIVDGNDFDGKGRLSFIIPLRKAIEGRGSLFAQAGRTRISYAFEINQKDILVNDDNQMKVKVVGNYRINTHNTSKETAIITLDKINNLVSIEGSNIQLEDMEVIMSRGC